jgi:hypothetical protein
MRQLPKNKHDQPREKKAVLIVLGKKIPKPDCAGVHFFKEWAKAAPLIVKRQIHAIEENQPAGPDCRRGQDERFGCPLP